MKIFCIGDSLTEGDLGKIKGIAILTKYNYPYYLHKLTNLEVVNYGVCGYSALDMYKKINKERLLINKEDIVLIMLGTNFGLSCLNNTNLIAYEDIIKYVLESTKNIYLLTPPTQDRDENYEKYILNTVNEVYKLVNKYKLKLIDVYKYSNLNKENREVYQTYDKLHLSEKGYEYLANFIFNHIKEYL